MTLPRLDDARVILDGLDAAQRGCVLRQLLSSLVQQKTLLGGVMELRRLYRVLGRLMGDSKCDSMKM